MKKKLCSVVLLLLLAVGAGAQELSCKVKVLGEKIANTDKSVFQALERGITDFLNTRKWTSDDFAADERIECTILLNLTGKSGEDIYDATMNIQASRPVYNSGYNTSIFNFLDRKVRFRFSEFSTFNFDDNRVAGNDALASNLTATLAFYAYMILGLDYDSYQMNGGERFFKRAQNVVTNAPEGDGIQGWKAFEDKTNRYWMTEQLLNPRFNDFHQIWYAWHRQGLDYMAAKPEEGTAKIMAALNLLSRLNQENPNSAAVQLFFAAKSDEITRILAQQSRQERTPYVTLLGAMDPANSQRYNALK